MKKVYLRLLPFCFILYFICYLDRVNIGFAALTMNKDLVPVSLLPGARGSPDGVGNRGALPSVIAEARSVGNGPCAR
jgi:hypothetical protein